MRIEFTDQNPQVSSLTRLHDPLALNRLKHPPFFGVI